MICVAFSVTTLPSVEMIFVRACLNYATKADTSLSSSRCFTDFCFFEKGYEFFCLFHMFSQLCFFVDTWCPIWDTRWTLEVICVSTFTEMYISTICCKWFLLSLIYPSPFSVKLSLIHNIIWSVKLIIYSLLMTNPQNGNCDTELKINR